VYVKSIIDSHIIENEKFYRDFCRNLYRNRYLMDDLFNDFYLKLVEMPDKVKEYSDKDNLKNLCCATIWYLWSKRGRKTSLLNEVCNLDELKQDFPTDSEGEYDIEQASLIINDILKNRNTLVPVLITLQAQDESLRSIERKTGIGRNTLSKRYKEGFEIIKTRFINELN
jgi:DNA-directed RNA polymerase specialized sigma24 family protein